jgi:hypothetical protein
MTIVIAQRVGDEILLLADTKIGDPGQTSRPHRKSAIGSREKSVQG